MRAGFALLDVLTIIGNLLDLAFGLTHTSRLGCQIRITEALDGLVVKLPAATRNMMVDK